MFTAQWNIENYFAPLFVWLSCEILKWIFVQIVEHIKKAHFLLAKCARMRYITQALRGMGEFTITSYQDLFGS